MGYLPNNSCHRQPKSNCCMPEQRCHRLPTQSSSLGFCLATTNCRAPVAASLLPFLDSKFLSRPMYVCSPRDSSCGSNIRQATVVCGCEAIFSRRIHCHVSRRLHVCSTEACFGNTAHGAEQVMLQVVAYIVQRLHMGSRSQAMRLVKSQKHQTNAQKEPKKKVSSLYDSRRWRRQLIFCQL